MADIAVFQEQQSSGVAGTNVTTTITKQTLNTEVFNNITGLSISSNDITAPAGNFVVNIMDAVRLGDANGYPVRYFLKTSGGTILDDSRSSNSLLSTTPTFTNQVTLAFSLSVSTVFSLYCDTQFGTHYRAALSDGIECYQKLMIQKVG